VKGSAVLTAAAGLLALTGGLVAPASAAPLAETYVRQGSGKEICPSGYVCLYEHFHLNRDTPDWKVLVTNQDVSNLGGSYNMNDRTSSVYNNSSYTVRLYPYYNYWGVPLTVFPGETFDFTNDENQESGWYDDKYSSLKFVSGTR